MADKKIKIYGVYNVVKKCRYQLVYNGRKSVDGEYTMLFIYDKVNNVYIRVPWDNQLTQRDIKAFIKGYKYSNPTAEFEYEERTMTEYDAIEW